MVLKLPTPETYLRRTRRLKYGLILASALVFIMLVVMLAGARQSKRGLIDDTMRANLLTEPRFDGRTRDGAKYSIRAAGAQKRGDLRLQTLHGSFNNGQNQISAPSAVLLEKLEQFEFYGPVLVSIGTETNIIAEQINFDLKTGDIFSNRALHVDHRFGTLSAMGFRLAQKTQTLTFDGKIELKLNQP